MCGTAARKSKPGIGDAWEAAPPHRWVPSSEERLINAFSSPSKPLRWFINHGQSGNYRTHHTAPQASPKTSKPRTVMFFFVGGVTPRVAATPLPARTCPGCGRAGGLEERRVDHRLSLFLLPAITVHRGRPFLACGGCGWSALGAAGVGKGVGGGESEEGGGATGAGGEGRRRLEACPHCGTALQEAWSFCPFCGAGL
jgi:hypothetical protein